MDDGLIDSRKDTSYLTVSWNVLGEHNKAFGIGWTDNVTAQMTIHHNWIHDTNQRNPSTDNVAYAPPVQQHLQNITSYGNYARGATKMVLREQLRSSASTTRTTTTPARSSRSVTSIATPPARGPRRG